MAESEFASILTPTGFTPVELQVAQFRQWNQRAGGFFADWQIHEALVAAPDFKWDRPKVPASLCWTMNTPEQSLDSYLAVMRWVYGEDMVYVSPDFKIDAEHTTFVEGAPEFTPNRLWWEVMDIDANRDKAPDQVPPATAGVLQVFCAVCQHRNHPRRAGTTYLDVPGLRVKVEGRSEPYAPYIYWCSDGKVRVGVYDASHAHPYYGGPEVELQS